MQLTTVIGENCKIEEIGMRPGEKLYESMIAHYESYLTIDNDNNRYKWL